VRFPSGLNRRRVDGHHNGVLPGQRLIVLLRRAMIVLGIVLLLIGFILAIPVLWTIGIILLVVGLIFELLGATGRAVGGRRHNY
jgi:Zn-dependent membrane protease YugP